MHFFPGDFGSNAYPYFFYFCFCHANFGVFSCDICSWTNVKISKLFLFDFQVFLGQIWLVTLSMKTILKDKLCGVKIKKIRLLFLKGQRFKNVFFFSNSVENLVIHPSICLSTTTTPIITK